MLCLYSKLPRANNTLRLQSSVRTEEVVSLQSSQSLLWLLKFMLLLLQQSIITMRPWMLYLWHCLGPRPGYHSSIKLLGHGARYTLDKLSGTLPPWVTIMSPVALGSVDAIVNQSNIHKIYKYSTTCVFYLMWCFKRLILRAMMRKRYGNIHLHVRNVYTNTCI